MSVSRRVVLGSGLALPVALAGGGEAQAAKPRPASADLRWLGALPPPAPGAAVWGTPWPRGAVKPKTTLTALGPGGPARPLTTTEKTPRAPLKTLASETGAAGRAVDMRAAKKRSVA